MPTRIGFENVRPPQQAKHESKQKRKKRPAVDDDEESDEHRTRRWLEKQKAAEISEDEQEGEDGDRVVTRVQRQESVVHAVSEALTGTSGDDSADAQRLLDETPQIVDADELDGSV